MNAQQRTLNDLKIGVHVQIDKSGHIRFGQQPMMGLPSVKIIDMESVAKLEKRVKNLEDENKIALEAHKRQYEDSDYCYMRDCHEHTDSCPAFEGV